MVTFLYFTLWLSSSRAAEGWIFIEQGQPFHTKHLTLRPPEASHLFLWPLSMSLSDHENLYTEHPHSETPLLYFTQKCAWKENYYLEDTRSSQVCPQELVRCSALAWAAVAEDSHCIPPVSGSRAVSPTGPHSLPIHLPQAPGFRGISWVHGMAPSLACNPARKDISPAPTTRGYMGSGHTGLHHQGTGSLLTMRFGAVTCPH